MPEQSPQNSPALSNPASPPAPQNGGWVGKLFLGVLLSLFVCPGIGHRIMGRHQAYKTILIAFFGTFLVLAVSVYSLVQGLVQDMTARGSFQFQDVMNTAAKSVGNVSLATASLAVLGIIYFVAPIELVLTELIRRYS